MKTKQEQIEEMAPHMCFVCEMNDGFHECIQHGDELCGMVYEAADRIYSAGYRKASDVIDEFVKNIMTDADAFLSTKSRNIIRMCASKMKKELAVEMQQEVQK